MIYNSDLHVAMNGTSLVWVGGLDVIDDATQETITRFVYDSKPYDYVDPISGKKICDMTEEELTTYKGQLQSEQLLVPEHSKFITDYEDAKSKGLY